MSIQFNILPYNSGVNYKKFDAVRNIFSSGVSYTSPIFYSTQDSQNQHPSGIFFFPITQYNRVDDVTTLRFSQTGNIPSIVAGSIIRVTGIATDRTINYSGMVIDGGSGWCKYINPGWATGLAGIPTGALTCYNPAWTTGFFFIPTYSTKVPTQNSVIEAKLGDGYAQRQSAGLNSFTQSYNMIFQSRGQREMKALTVFFEDHAGVYPFEILIPDQFMSNQPNQKFTSKTMDATPVAFQLFDINITVDRVFDI